MQANMVKIADKRLNRSKILLGEPPLAYTLKRIIGKN